MLVKDHYS